MRHLRSPMLIIFAVVLAFGLAPPGAWASEFRLPGNTVAGQPLTITTAGEGDATVYLVGPSQVLKRQVRLGGEIQIKGEELRSAGRWVAILREGSKSSSQVFSVQPGRPENLSFLARPSRVPVARAGAISGIAFVFDRYENLVLEPAPIKFSLSIGGTAVSQSVTSRDGVAWISSSSARKAGAAQFIAATNDTSVRRVVQQVASDPCNLRMRVVERTNSTTVVETDPIRDCTGNPVPDGTIVTFTQTDAAGRSTVDARIKRGIARAGLPPAANAVITVASGVVLGNELHLGGAQ
jgi:hypothetical protein